MPNRASTQKHRMVSASDILNALGSALGKIKAEDGLTWADLGSALGKSPDRAALYVAGHSAMDVTTFYRAKAIFNGRFTRDADALVEKVAADTTTDHAKLSAVMKAAHTLVVALEDGEVKDDEIMAGRKELEAARDGIDALLARLTPKAVKA